MGSSSHRESVLLGYFSKGSFEDSMKTSDEDSDMDFSDVFGGPPRRFSIQESRSRFSSSEAREESDEDAVFPRSSWSALEEKPVFGEESGNRKLCQSDNFFDDIFKGDGANNSRRSSRDFFASSSSGSRISSPSKPLQSKAEPLSTSLPAQFSLPAKLIKATDFPHFGSTDRSSYKNKDGLSNGTRNEQSSNGYLSRFANQATEVQDEARKDRPVYRRSPLSNEVSHTGEDSSCDQTESSEKDMGAKLKNDAQSKGNPLSSGQFHFSIYKWAGSGVPLLMPLGGRSKSRFKENFKTERCSSSNGRIESDDISTRLPTVEEQVISIDTESFTLKINSEKDYESRNHQKIDSCTHVEETNLTVPEVKYSESEGNATKLDEGIARKKTEEESLKKNETNVHAGIEKQSSFNKTQALKTEGKPLHELLNVEDGEQGIADKGNENKVKAKNIPTNNVSTSRKISDAKGTNSNRSEITKEKKSSATNSGDANGRTRVKGKVKEFVKIFNQETTTPSNSESDKKSSRLKETEIKDGTSTAVKTEEKVQKLDNIAGASSRVDVNSNKNKGNQESHFKSSVRKPSGPCTNENSVPSNYDNNVDYKDDSFFMVEELTRDEDKGSQTTGVSADIQDSNAKIQQWSSGRKGNIRSLLSTLQLVLWPQSGWKPVPLVDLIEASAVRKSYQRALLCLHPDKLQQKGAASHQKYIAEQVFDILQEAWDHFNSLGAI